GSQNQSRWPQSAQGRSLAPGQMLGDPFRIHAGGIHFLIVRNQDFEIQSQHAENLLTPGRTAGKDQVRIRRKTFETKGLGGAWSGLWHGYKLVIIGSGVGPGCRWFPASRPAKR